MEEIDLATTEEWRPVPGAEGWYSVSNLGRVRSEPTTGWRPGKQRGRVLRLSRDSKGYLMFKLCLPGMPPRSVKAHRVVAQAFLGPAPAGLQVNHKNGDKADNRVENLEYVSCRENIRHCWDTGLHGVEHCRGEANRQAKLTENAVRFIREAHPQVSLGELATTLGVTKQAVAMVVKRRTWKHV